MKKTIVLMLFIFLSACSTESVMVEEVQPPVIEPEVLEPEVNEDLVEDAVTEEVEVTYPFVDDLDVLADLGRVAVISNSMYQNRAYPFLEGLNANVYNDIQSFDESNYDTLVIFYQENQLSFYPPMNWGVSTIEVGQLLRRTVRGKTVIMAHFESFLETVRQFELLDGRLLTLSEDSTIERFFEWQSLNPLVAKPEDVEVLAPIELSNTDRLAPIDVCRIRQTKTHRGDPPQSKGFPLRYNVVPTKGIVNVAFVAVDFPDVQGNPEMIDQWLEEIYNLEAWSHFMASGIMEYRVHFEPQWITTPKEAKWYGCESCMRVIMGDYNETYAERLQPEMEAINQVFTAADDYYDWANMDFAQLMFPTQAEADPHWVRLYSHGGNNFTPKAGNVFVPVFGGFIGWMAPEFTDYTMWDFAAHEILHEQGLMGHGPYNGANYSVMQNQHGYSKMLLSWEAFLLDWWDEDHLACIELEDLDEPFVFEIDPLDRNGILVEGPKNLMVRLNQEEIVVIEYRTDGPFSELPKELQGITAYHVNVNQPQFRCDQGCEDLTLEEYDAKNFWRYIKDPTTDHPCIPGEFHPVYGYLGNRFCNQPAFVHYPGASITWENLKITVLSENIVEIQRIS